MPGRTANGRNPKREIIEMSLYLALPTHPTTGLTAIGWRRNGAPIWPVMGGSGEGDPPTDDGGADAPPADDQGDKPEPRPDQPELPKPDSTDWKARSREWEKRAKANSEAAKKLAEIEEANKSAEQKAAEAHATAEKRAADAERALLRFRVAAKAGLDSDLAERLRGESEGELLADAEALKAKFAPAPVKPSPKPDPSQGGKEPAKPSTTTGRDLWAQRHPSKAK